MAIISKLAPDNGTTLRNSRYLESELNEGKCAIALTTRNNTTPKYLLLNSYASYSDIFSCQKYLAREVMETTILTYLTNKKHAVAIVCTMAKNSRYRLHT